MRDETSRDKLNNGPTPNTDQAIEFLRWAIPDEDWVLTSIHPETGSIETQTLNPVQARPWIDARQGTENLYWHVNSTLRPLSKKAEKKDIKAVRFFHVDIDYQSDDLVAERARLVGLVTDRRPRGVPEPSATIFSGGGVQIFYRLATPIVINGDVKRAEEAERYNHKLEQLLDADPCGNADRIMRIPGTINLPNKKKIARGRVAALAMVLDSSDRTYTVDAFGAADARQLPELATIGQKVTKIDDWDELTVEVPDRIKIVCAQGRLEEDKQGDNSRSAWLLDAVCGLVRARVPDEFILGIVLDSGWAISESVLEAKHPLKYAQRQIARARELTKKPPGEWDPSFSTVDAVDWVNQRYFAILNGGKTQFYREEGRKLIKIANQDTFKFELAPFTVPGTKQPLSAANLWISSQQRRYYPNGFELNAETTTKGAFNLWRGFAVEPEEGDWSLMRAHIKDVLADGDTKLEDYIVNWAAWALQNPDKPAKVALVFQGEEGVGKGIFANAIKNIFGENLHGMRVQSMNHLVGNFNAHLRDVCLLFCDEAVVTGSDTEGVLKGLITEDTIPIEGKGVDVVSAQNHLHVIMASNNEWVVPAGKDSRRFAVLRVSSKRKGDQAHFKLLVDQLYRQGGLEAMAYELLNLDLKGWHPEKARPETQALEEQRASSLRGFERVWNDILTTSVVPHSEAGEGCITASELQLYASRVLKRDDAPTLNKIGDVLKRSGCTKERGTGGRNHWKLPTLSNARKNWNAKFEWDATTEWDQPVYVDPPF